MLLPFRFIAFEKETAEVSELVKASDFVIELWVDSDVEVIEDFLNLCHVFVLHFSSGYALLAIHLWVGEEHLVDDDVVNVDVLFGQLDT